MCDSTALRYGMSNSTRVPETIAVCPECGAPLHVEADMWEIESGHGYPARGALNINCVDDANSMGHRYFQSDWQPIYDAVEKWAGCVEV